MGYYQKVKEAVAITVIGNGDIFTPEDVLRMMAETGCDGVMIGRGCLGNPWLIKRAIHLLNTGELLPEPDYEEIIEMALLHLKEAVAYFGEKGPFPDEKTYCLVSQRDALFYRDKREDSKPYK